MTKTIIDLLESAKILAKAENNLLLSYLIDMAQQEALMNAKAPAPKKAA